MSGFTLVEKVLFCLDVAAMLCLVLRLLSSGLSTVYRLFFAFIVVSLAGEIAIVFFREGTNAYGWWFIGLESVRIIFSAVIILDLYSLVLRDLPGLKKLANRYITLALAISIVVSLLLLGLEQSPATMLFKYYVFYRAISTSLVLFILFITAFLLYYPVPLARNVIVYTVGYAVYFLAHAAGFLLLTTGSPDQPWQLTVSKVLQAVSVASLLYWVIFLNREGETKIRAMVPRMNREQERLVLQKLQAVNASLLRVAKK